MAFRKKFELGILPNEDLNELFEDLGKINTFGRRSHLPSNIKSIVDEETNSLEKKLKSINAPYPSQTEIQALTIPTEEGVVVLTVGKVYGTIPDEVEIEETTEDEIHPNEKILNEMRRLGYGDRHLIKQDINYTTSEHGVTILQVASKNGQLNLVKALVYGGAKINLADNYGMTALHLAVKHERLTIVRFLLENNADIHLTDKKGWTAFHLTAENGNLEIMKALFKKGKENPLVDMSEYINKANEDGWAALHFPCQYGNVDMVKYLVEKGADIDVENIKLRHYPPILVAAQHKHNDIVMYLAKRGAFLDRNDPPMKELIFFIEKLRQAEKNQKSTIIHFIQPTLLQILEKAFDDHAITVPKVKHGMWAGSLPRDLNEIKSLINNMKNSTCPMQTGLTQIIASVKKSGNHKKILDAAITCQNLMTDVLSGKIGPEEFFNNYVRPQQTKPSRW